MKIVKSFLIYAIGVTIAATTIFRLMEKMPQAHLKRIKQPGELSPSQLMAQLSSSDLKAPTEKDSNIQGRTLAEHDAAVEEEPEPSLEEEGHSEENEEEHEEGHHISDGSRIVFFIIATLFIGCVLKEIKKKTNIPFTPMILIVGLLMGFYSKKLYFLGECTELINKIDPHTLLMIFIPGLVFEGAYNTDAYVFGKSKWQVLIMAGPGVLITSFILAWAFTDLFNYTDINFSEALVIGSIISTTDPVAVVALLKELGASTRFKTILEGESLLNDGTAYVFFLVCLDVVESGGIDWVSAGIKFVRLSFGGPAFGIFIGFLVSKWVKRIRKDSGLIAVISVVACYSVFFFSENYLVVSGILALVSLGVYLSGFMKVNLSHEIDHTMHTVWGFCGFSLESLIFLISGTYIGAKFSNYEDLTLTTTDIWKACLFYPFLTFIRYLVTLIQLPVLNMVGYNISVNSALILTYGGLRGAIALSLAMLVAVNENLDQHLRDVCLFYVVTTIVFTVCVNGLTIKYVMKWSGFLKKDPIKEKMKHNVLRKMLINTMKEKRLVKEEDGQNGFNGANWDSVDEMSKLK
jgi:NhaP-type Na+/H+ or K+/H+ antiporter